MLADEEQEAPAAAKASRSSLFSRMAGHRRTPSREGIMSGAASHKRTPSEELRDKQLPPTAEERLSRGSEGEATPTKHESPDWQAHAVQAGKQVAMQRERAHEPKKALDSLAGSLGRSGVAQARANPAEKAVTAVAADDDDGAQATPPKRPPKPSTGGAWFGSMGSWTSKAGSKTVLSGGPKPQAMVEVGVEPGAARVAVGVAEGDGVRLGGKMGGAEDHVDDGLRRSGSVGDDSEATAARAKKGGSPKSGAAAEGGVRRSGKVGGDAEGAGERARLEDAIEVNQMEQAALRTQLHARQAELMSLIEQHSALLAKEPEETAGPADEVTAVALS